MPEAVKRPTVVHSFADAQYTACSWPEAAPAGLKPHTRLQSGGFPDHVGDPIESRDRRRRVEREK